MLDLCDSNKRWQNFVHLMKRHEKINGKKDHFGNFTEEILQPRNFLAHGYPVPQQDGSYIFHYQNKQYFLNDDVSTDLRKKILTYKKEFSDILGILRNE